MEAFLDITKDIWDYLKIRNKNCLAILIITIVIMDQLTVFKEGSVKDKFFYLMF